MSTVEEKCRLIATFEGAECEYCHSLISGHPNKVCNSFDAPDYPHSVDATMRAARRLHPRRALRVDSMGGAQVIGLKGLCTFSEEPYCEPTADPARAAFEALAAYLANAGVSGGRDG